jgi:hypothetical protein
LWLNKDRLKERLFDKSEIEPTVKVEFFDLPGFYHFEDPCFEKFYGALADSDNYELFKVKPIERAIDFNFKIVRNETIKKLFMPFAVFHFLYVTYLNFVYEQRENPDLDTRLMFYPIDLSMMVILGLFASYFLANEIRQFRKDGLDYLASIWNWIDIIPPIGIFIMLCINIMSTWIDFNNSFERVIQAIATFFMWFKLLYFLRIF